MAQPMIPYERRKIERRIAKADRRLARGIDVRQEVMGGEVSETQIKVYLTNKLKGGA